MPKLSRRIKVVLKFINAGKLWEFYRTVQPLRAEMRLRTSVLICECNAAEIELAEAKFGAVVTHGNA
jgi:hypothetical protein